MPANLTPKEQKILAKIRKRAHRLDKGMSLCGFRVGYTFFLGFIPFAGDIANALLGYNLVTKQAKKVDIVSVAKQRASCGVVCKRGGRKSCGGATCQRTVARLLCLYGVSADTTVSSLISFVSLLLPADTVSVPPLCTTRPPLSVNQPDNLASKMQFK